MSAKRLFQITDPSAPGYIQESLFDAPKTSYNPYPRLVSKVEDIREIMRRGAEEGKIGLDFEGQQDRPTIFGVANKATAGAVRYDVELVKEIVELAEKSGAVIVGHSTIGAEKQYIENALERKTPVSIYGCSMIGHHLTNGHLTKMAGKQEEEDAGSLGLMGLATVASLETDVPAYKFCRGKWCEGPCPTHRVFDYCAVDAWASLAAAYNQEAEMTSLGIPQSFYRDCLELTDICMEMEKTGLRIDREWVKHMDKAGTEFKNTLFPYDLINKKPVYKEFNPKAAPQITEYFAGLGITLKDSTKSEVAKVLEKVARKEGISGETIKELCSNLELEPELSPGLDVLYRLFQYKDAGKGVKSWFDEKYYGRDGRIHPRFITTGTCCMPAGELVLTRRGYIPVEKVLVGDSVFSHTGVPRKVTDTIYNGIKPIFKVTLASGLELKTTGNHPYLIGDKWIPAEELVPGMLAWAHTGKEEWKKIPNWEDFSVSSWGRVNNDKTGRIVTQYPKGSWGHLKVMLRRKGAQKRGENLRDFAVHRLVAEAFVPKTAGTEVRHLNGYAWDNTKENLAWGTSKENTKDAARHGTSCLRNSPRAKLTEEIVTAIRESLGEKNNQKIAVKFGVSRALVCGIRNGTRWTPREVEGKVVKFFQDEIVKIEKLEDAPTFGLTVEEDHSHITGGVITHNTGRLSSSRPNFQNLGARGWAKELKKAIIPDDGYDFVESDWSQLELRIILYLAGFDVKQIPLDAFKWLVSQAPGAFDKAASLMAMSSRDVAKSISHGSDYLEGIQIKSGQELETERMQKEIREGARVVYTKKNYPQLTRDWTFRGGYVTFTGANLAERIFGSKTLENRKKAHEIVEGIYFKEFFAIREWQMRVLEQAETGLVKSPAGRVLKLHGSPEDDAKMAVAFFGQGVGADHARSVILWRKRNEGLIPVLTVHDSVIQQVPKDWSDAKAKAIMASMQEETPLLPGFVNPGKVKRGPNYGDIELI